jgi:hypothetical protein
LELLDERSSAERSSTNLKGLRSVHGEPNLFVVILPTSGRLKKDRKKLEGSSFTFWIHAPFGASGESKTLEIISCMQPPKEKSCPLMKSHAMGL